MTLNSVLEVLIQSTGAEVEFTDNKDLTKFFRSLLGSEQFQKMAYGAQGENFYECYMMYVMATRSVPNAETLQKMKDADLWSLWDVTAIEITRELSNQIKAKGKYFTPTKRSIYTRFCENVYKNGILFSGRKVHDKANIIFPNHFKKLAIMQADNPVVKAYTYKCNHGREMDFYISPAAAFDNARENKFWLAMLDGESENSASRDVDGTIKKIHESISKLYLDTDEKTRLFKDIVESFKDYIDSNNIDISMIDSADTYGYVVRDIMNRPTEENFGNGIPYKSYEELCEKGIMYFDEEGKPVIEKDFRTPEEVIKKALADYHTNYLTDGYHVTLSRDYFNKHGRSVVMEKPDERHMPYDFSQTM